MNKTLAITAACLGVVCLIYYGYQCLPDSKPEPPEELARQALDTKSEQKVQERAAAQLAKAPRPAECKQLNRVLRQSKAPAVRAACIRGLGVARDYESMDTLLDALEDESPLVRGRAGVAITRLLGRDYHFRAQDPPAKRAEAIKNIRNYWNEMKGSPQLKAYQQRLRQENKP